MTGVVNAVYNGADMVLCVLDNSTTAMTRTSASSRYRTQPDGKYC